MGADGREPLPTLWAARATCAAPLDAGCSVAGCAFGDTEIGTVCLKEDLAPGAPIAVQVLPRGCFSSSCTIVLRSLCQVARSDGGLAVTASFCLRDTGGPICTADCSGGGFANCAFADGLPAGDYKLRPGELELAFSVPSQVPPGGLCAGSMF